MTAASPELKRTPLNAIHRSLGAKMVDFGGWDMPVEYKGVLDEHRAVRERVGLFDVSHMGEIEISARPLGGSLVLGEVVRFHLDETIVDARFRIDPDQLRAVGRMGGAAYCRTLDRFELARP